MTNKEIQASDEEMEQFYISQNEKCVLAEEEKAFVNNPTPTIQEEVLTLRIENAELKEQVGSLANTNIKAQNIIADLKEQNEAIKQEFIEAKYRNEEYIKQIEKMKNCGNCKKRGFQCVAEEQQGILCGKNKWEFEE